MVRHKHSPDEGAILHLASSRSANSAHSRTLGSVGSTLSNSSYSSFEIHICCGSPAQARLVCGSQHEQKHGLKAITSQIEKQPAHHARSTTNVHRATCVESYAHCVNCDMNCFKTSNANLLRDSFNLLAQQRIRSSGLTELLLALNPTASRRHDPRRFQIRYVLLHFSVSSLQSTNRRFASRFHQLVSKLGVTLLRLNT